MQKFVLVPVDPDDVMVQVLESSLTVTNRGSFLNAKSALAKVIAAVPQPTALGGEPEVHRYRVVKMLSEAGNKISYDPYGPWVVTEDAHRAHVARLQAEVERMTGRNAELEGLLKEAKNYGSLRYSCRTAHNVKFCDFVDRIDAALAEGKEHE